MTAKLLKATLIEWSPETEEDFVFLRQAMRAENCSTRITTKEYDAPKTTEMLVFFDMPKEEDRDATTVIWTFDSNDRGYEKNDLQSCLETY